MFDWPSGRNRFPWNRRHLIILCVFLSLTLGLLVRAPYFLKNDFILNDGALFAQMAETIRAAGFEIPDVIRYNHTSIPFAYPPLSFYLVAAVAEIFSIPVLAVVKYLPLAFNLLCIGCLVLLTARLTPNRMTIVLTALLFPLIPKSYEWVIMGGGVSRSVGFFFALLTAVLGTYLFERFTARRFVLCVLALACAGLSHLEWGITASVTLTILVLSRAVTSARVVLLATTGLCAALITMPWLLTVLDRHGLAPFLAAVQTAEWGPLTTTRFSGTLQSIIGFLQVPATLLMLAGCAVCVVRRDWFLPIWLIAIFITTPRHGPTAATMPLAILSARGIAEVVWPLLVRAQRGIVRIGLLSSQNRMRIVRWMALVAMGSLLAFAALDSYVSYARKSALISLTNAERAAMEWIRSSTRRDALFLVVSRSISWQDDRVAEWFPYLTGRESLNTVQGLEWVPGGVFQERVAQALRLKWLQANDPRAIPSFFESSYVCHDYVAVFFPGALRTFGQWVFSVKYLPVYGNSGTLILKNDGPDRCRWSE